MPLVAEATDFGIDVGLIRGLGASMGIVADLENLANAILRRLTCPKGELAYDTSYGIDVRLFVNAAMTDLTLTQMRSAIVSEVEREPRVQSCAATLKANIPLRAVRIALVIDTATGPFDLVFDVSELTVTRLGQTLVEAAAAAAPSTGLIVTGPPGPQGPAGSSGGGGGTGLFPLEQAAQMAVNSTTEKVVFEQLVSFGDLGSPLTARLTALISVVAGTGTFRVYVGGTTDTADGTLIITATTVSATYVAVAPSATFANPTGIQRVKVTAQNDTLNQDARIRDIVLTFA